MSLGYNTQKPVRVVDLPGATGSSLLIRRESRMPRSRRAPDPAALARAIGAAAPKAPDPEALARAFAANSANAPAKTTARAPDPVALARAFAASVAREPPVRGADSPRAVKAAPPAAPAAAAAPAAPDEHWAYGTALRDLFEVGEPAEAVAREGDRVLFVYPQRYDAETGKVEMRAKLVDTDTAQLRYAWVEIYSGLDSDRRHAGKFSLVC